MQNQCFQTWHPVNSRVSRQPRFIFSFENRSGMLRKGWSKKWIACVSRIIASFYETPSRCATSDESSCNWNFKLNRVPHDVASAVFCNCHPSLFSNAVLKSSFIAIIDLTVMHWLSQSIFRVSIFRWTIFFTYIFISKSRVLCCSFGPFGRIVPTKELGSVWAPFRHNQPWWGAAPFWINLTIF